MRTFEKYRSLQMSLLSYKLLAKCLVLLHCELAILFFVFCELNVRFLLATLHV